MGSSEEYFQPQCAHKNTDDNACIGGLIGMPYQKLMREKLIGMPPPPKKKISTHVVFALLVYCFTKMGGLEACGEPFCSPPGVRPCVSLITDPGLPHIWACLFLS